MPARCANTERARNWKGVPLNTNHTRKVLTISDVMEMTGRGVSVVGDALRSGALKGVQSRPRASWVITEAAVDAWIAEGCPRYGRAVSA